jgi:hypothetical protein
LFLAAIVLSKIRFDGESNIKFLVVGNNQSPKST